MAETRTERRALPIVPALLLAAAGAAVFYKLYHVLIPFALGFALAYVANPIVSYGELHGLRRWVVVVGLYALAVGTLALAASSLSDLVVTQFASAQTALPKYAARSRELAAGFQAVLVRRLPYGYGAALTKQLDERLYGPLLDQLQKLPTYLLGLFPLLSLLLLVPFVAFFLMLDGADAVEGFIQACPSRYVEQALHMISEIDSSLGSYLRGLILEAAAVATAVFVGLLSLDVNQALPLALLAGALAFIPEFGIVLSAATAALVAGFQFGALSAGLKVAALFAGVKLLDYVVLQPIIAKHSVHLHTLAMIAVLMIGGELFGVVGLIFAVPVVCILKSLAKVAWTWYATEAQLRGPELAESPALPYT